MEIKAGSILPAFAVVVILRIAPPAVRERTDSAPAGAAVGCLRILPSGDDAEACGGRCEGFDRDAAGWAFV
jgi:hypothetical protein